MADDTEHTVTLNVKEWDRLAKEFKAQDADLKGILALERDVILATIELEAAKLDMKEKKAAHELACLAVHRAIRRWVDPQGYFGFGDGDDEDAGE